MSSDYVMPKRALQKRLANVYAFVSLRLDCFEKICVIENLWLVHQSMIAMSQKLESLLQTKSALYPALLTTRYVL